ncbi:ATP-dependent DNA helicase RecG [Peptacetobacter hiranonis DSM 13275]|uniref:ATP-dependent DNA helicase RecG n=1 Tax=Peptacetobacter hiranonis (strain DSM 13275 / JCM 10541 / KCTC 15199 / TO-931) TaxID=500633 RepID=B6FZ19_PEPHT|nr:ATP-dependent DNA helicase RecG [Peptacetobacter hiranonis DSM 13275]
MINLFGVINESIQYVKGIGPKKAEKLNKLGIYTIKDLLYYFPRQFEDRSVIKKIAQLEDEEKVTVKALITNIESYTPKKGMTITRIDVKDDTGFAKLTFFNREYIKNTFRVGDSILAFGKVKKNGRFVELNSCELEYLSTSPKNIGKLVPVYPLSYGITNKDIMNTVRMVFENKDIKIPEYMPEYLLKKYRLCGIDYAIKNIHFPKDKESLKVALYRLIFEELLVLQLGLFMYKGGNSNEKGILFKRDQRLDEVLESLPFSLTRAQNRALNEIIDDMCSEKVMNRLVQGDVGSGKTVVALLALAECVFNGYQGALMAPTEILAQQHYESFTETFEDIGINVELLTGSVTKKQKEGILHRARDGEIDILIGTHALIEDNVEFKNIGLVITDEQHRFGVRQRGKLSSKGTSPDILVMTATPIPRTLALILYGDLDISIIDELPPGRQPIETIAVEKKKRDKVYNSLVRREVDKGRQVYIVCPLVEESESLDITSATETAEEIKRDFFPDLRVGLLHGKMKPSEKDAIMTAFKNHELDILVSTTVIEVGVNVPNSTLMIIENAERFGLAQLHQLRGRVGRGKHQSYCVLIYGSNSEVCRKRMGIMEETNDGFKISEKDLEIRGPGEFFGTMQHGVPELKVANLFKHMKILKTVQQEARIIIGEDSTLDFKEYRGLKREIESKFKDKIEKDITMN